ncbi:succinoglycan biosynthesis protein exop [Mesorhizobium sp. NBSH29]|uniref:GNVR domain-containing protein n=1 Tax=Mesorhizobium sp. NBSH29 TaxID=2654249 RepID=UPI001896742E|nr:GNVR domain-containing protein [Mesorhizobium sp. NBSH29]QPC86784.1 succinoglycan biosynthesis protein exop [Mesorhizobium sp. NBSH29]
MSDAHDHDRKKRSLLSLGRAEPEGRGRSRNATEGTWSTNDEIDAATRHRLARSRREAHPSPLISALAERPNSSPRDRTPERAPVVEQSSPAPKSRWSLRNLLPDSDRSQNPREHEQPAWVQPERDTSHPYARQQHADEDPRASTRASETADPDLYWRPLIDPMRVVVGIANSKKIILATTIAGALLAAAVAVSTPKKFEGVAELLIDPRDLKIVDRDITQSGLPSDATMAIVENQVRVLTSGTVLNKVVDKLNLTADPEFNGQGSGVIGSPVAILRSLLARDAGSAGDNRRSLAVSNLAESLEVERGGKTFVVVITAKTQNAEKSALIANTLTDVFLQTYGQIQADTAGRATDELTSRLSGMRSELEAAERAVEEYKTQNDIIDAGGKLISDDEMVKLNEQLGTARARSIELNAKAQSARDLDVNAVVNGILPEQISSNVMTELRSQYSSLSQEADRLAVRLGPRHPQLLAIQAQLGGAREQIQNELRRIVASNQVELKRAVQLEQDLAARLAQVKVRQSGVSEDLVALRQLEREAAAKRAVYESFLLRARETSEQRDLNTANMAVISKAYPPLEPVGPSRSTLTLAGALLGMLAGIGIGGMRGAFYSLRDNSNPGTPRDPRPTDGGRGPSGPSGRRRDMDHETRKPEPEPAPRRPARVPEARANWNALVQPAGSGEDDAVNDRIAPNPARHIVAATRRDRASKSEAPIPVRVAEAPRPAAVAVAPIHPAPVQHAPAAVQLQPAAQVHLQAVPPQQPVVYAPQMQPAYMPAPMQPQPMAYAYPPQPMPMFYPGQPMPMPQAYMPPMPHYGVWPAPHFAPQPSGQPVQEPAATRSDIEEVRESLRAFREAVLDRPELRPRRRFL